MNIIFAGLAALAILVSGSTQAQASDSVGYGKQKVVYHINYPGGKEDVAYKRALKNIQNHINAVGAKNLDMKVIVHGDGIFMMKTAKTPGPLQTSIVSMKSQGVSISVCANTMKDKKIALSDMHEVFDEDVVMSGVAEISHLQEQGYTYIKP